MPCSLCKMPGHYKTTCPRKPVETTNPPRIVRVVRNEDGTVKLKVAKPIKAPTPPPPPSPTLSAEAPPFIISHAHKALLNAMTHLYAGKGDRDTWQLYRALYHSNPTAFTITHDIHQNDPGDTQHFSVKVMLDSKYSHSLHFYGYMKNTFRITHITRLSFGEVQTIITF